MARGIAKAPQLTSGLEATGDPVLSGEDLEALWKSMTKKQHAFTAQYLVNGYRKVPAMREAGYKGGRCHLARQAERNLAHPKMAPVVQHYLAQQENARLEAGARMAQWMRGDMADFIEIQDDGTAILDLKKAEELGVTMNIRDLDIEEGFDKQGNKKRTVKVKLHDAKDAAKHILDAHKDSGADVQVNIQQNNYYSRLREKYE